MPHPLDRLTDYETDLLQRARAWSGQPTLAAVNHEALRKLTRQQGVDFATAVLYDRLRRAPEHEAFIKRLESPCPPPKARRDLLVAVVPGYLYRERSHTGADGAIVLEHAQRLGYRTVTVPLPSRGGVRSNARLLGEWLDQQTEDAIVLASISKGGAEVKLVLANPGAERRFRKVRAWVNLCGLLSGTPLVSWLLARPLRRWLVRFQFWLRRYDFAVLDELRHGPGELLSEPLRVPEHLEVIHLQGFPLRQHFSSSLAARGHRRISPLGPNDSGCVLLGDLVGLPGRIYPVWGCDHYLRPRWDVGVLVERLLHHLSADTGEPG
jgi:hypothetical protein